MNEAEVPAPWNLKGYGYIFIYRFDEKFLKSLPFNDKQSVIKKHNYGSVMLVNYESSDAGPYKELLFIPGKVLPFKNTTYFTISRIFVSTMISVVNGRRNWGIPKEKADFKFEKTDKFTEKISVSDNNQIFFKASVKTSRVPFYINSGPFPIKLMQHYENKFYKVPFKGKSTLNLASVTDIKVNSAFFPDVSAYKPLLALKVNNFDLRFEKAEIFHT